jgi:death-on-curing family protein
LTTNQVQRLHQVYINGTAVPSQPGLLDSAINGPMNAKHYAKQENIFQLAANLSEKIMKNHAYQDGNKRTALIAANMFLQINGYKLQKVPFQEHDEANRPIAEAHVAVVTNKWKTEQLGDFYQSIATDIEAWTPEILAYRDGAIEY